jgi:hypothetical protein
MIKLLLIFPILLMNQTNILWDENGGEFSPTGPVINWQPDARLRWSDFKAKHKTSKGFAVATSTCGFGYEGIIKGDDLFVNVYVRFYCNESWFHKDYKLNEVLRHEQLHFDICELYGRIFYKNILFLRKSGSLNERTLNKTLYKLRNEYDAMQDRYDRETNHSTDRSKQFEWEHRIHNALTQNAAYARYKEY